eukprot:4295789-Karenia_brevis.AAC.1
MPRLMLQTIQGPQGTHSKPLPAVAECFPARAAELCLPSLFERACEAAPTRPWPDRRTEQHQ